VQINVPKHLEALGQVKGRRFHTTVDS